jgi:hypothetical protein
MIVCPLCGASNGIVFDRRERTPVLLNRTYRSAAEARAARTGSLAFTGCGTCGFVWNAAFDDAAIVYDGAYENDQAHSAVFRAHMASMAERALAIVDKNAAVHVVEVGAGQGVFLKTLADAAAGRLASATGFDPAWRGKPGGGPPPIKLYTDLFDANAALRLAHAPNLVVSRHTIEHVANPLAFLATIRAGLPMHAGVRVTIETPCVKWILDNWAIQDFFYEHCSLFTAHTLRRALEATGFEVTSADHVFGGQYLWAEAVTAERTHPVDWRDSARPDFAAWSRHKDDMLANWRSAIAKASADGPVYVWGAGAKGITFACLFDPQAKLLTGLVDINPNKQGTFAAMTGCPIIAPGAIRGPRPTVIVMNPIYQDEIRRTCAAMGIEPVISLFAPGERS